MLRIRLLCILFIVTTGLSAEPLVNRRVLLVNFVNQKKSGEADYLSVSVPEALIGPLQKTGSFEILSRDLAIDTAKKLRLSDTDLYTDATAVALGKATGAEVVVIGNYVVIKDTVMIQTKAIDTDSGRVKASKSVVGKTDGSIFETINRLALIMADDMKLNLPPIPQREIVREKTIIRSADGTEAGAEKTRSGWYYGGGGGINVLFPDTNLGFGALDTDIGPFVWLSAGKTLSHQLLLGVNVFAGATNARKPSSSSSSTGSNQQSEIPISTSHVDNFATLSYFPFGTGFNVRGGAGLTWTQYTTSNVSASTANAAGILATNGTYAGFGGLLQTGYSFWIGKSFNLGVNLAAIFARSNEGAANRLLLFVSFEWF